MDNLTITQMLRPPPVKQKIWVHFPTSWWFWYWSKNCKGKSPKPVHGLLPTLTYKWKDQRIEEAMKELKTVTLQARAEGFQVIPSLGVFINKGYDKGKEFQAWFDREAWRERGKWLEKMLPLAKDHIIGLDVEPYWKEGRGNPRYPSRKYQKRMMAAMIPFINVVKKHEIKLYVFPGGLNYTWNRAAANLGANLVMLDEESYGLPDKYKNDAKAYQKDLRYIKEKARGVKAAGMKYVPGFYESALKKPGFLNAISKLGYDEVWVFMRRNAKVHKYDKFCLPEFYR